MGRRILQILVLSGLLLCLSALLISVRAQQLDCSDAIKAAMKQVGDKCGNIGRNKACYGSGTVVATPNDGVQPQDFVFQSPGDKVDVNKLKSLRLTALDPTGQQFGVAYLEIQANLPDTDPTKYVTLILSGDTQLQNVSTAPSQAFQAVVIETGIQSPACHKAPTSGLLIQSRPGTGPVSLTVNGVQLGVSSTVFIQQPSSSLSAHSTAIAATMTPLPGATQSSAASHTLKISTLQVHVTVTANGHTKTVNTNQQTSVALDDQGDQPLDNGDPIEDATTIDDQDNPDWVVADGTDDSLIDALPTDEAMITDTPESTELPDITDTPEAGSGTDEAIITDTPESNEVPAITDTPDTESSDTSNNSSVSETAPTSEPSQPDENQPTDAPSSLRPAPLLAFAPWFN